MSRYEPIRTGNEPIEIGCGKFCFYFRIYILLPIVASEIVLEYIRESGITQQEFSGGRICNENFQFLGLLPAEAYFEAE